MLSYTVELNIHPPEVVPCYCDPQLRVGGGGLLIFVEFETKHLQIAMFEHSFHSQ